MSKLTQFYLGNGVDSEGRRIDEIWQWDDDELEAVHDYIQWLFPTTTRSAYNPHAPIPSASDIAEFRASAALRDRLRRSFTRFLQFLGLDFTDGVAAPAANFAERAAEVWAYANHNWLRVSRVLASLRLLGLEAEADAFFAWLDRAYRDGVIGSGDRGSRDEAAVSHAQWTIHATASPRN
jgi:hypothetical protein